MLIDTHAHLDMKDFDHDRSAVIHRAVRGGIEKIITIGTDPDSSRKALNLARKHDPIYAAVGFHPHDASAFTLQELEGMAQLATDRKIVAWGEIGLDYFRLRSPKEMQLMAFQRQLATARNLNLPVIIHDRDAHKDVFKLLKDMGKGNGRGVIHCFSGNKDLAASFIELGYYISIPGTVTFNKASKVRDVASHIALDRMLIETDAPFLAPAPKRGKRNEPLFVTHTAHEIARLRNMTFEDVARITTENAKTLFGIL